MGTISPAAPGPLYQQIIEGIKKEISTGRILPGHELPSFRALAEQLLVSVITVKRAYEELEREGLIYRRQGLGTFVAENADQTGRTAQLAQAVEFLEKGIQEARQSGLSEKDVAQLVKKLLNQNQE